jgi:hypothetical protein
MSQTLSELLGAPELSFHLNLRRLEQASGHLSHDVRLASEVMLTAHAKVHDLGLDEHDSTGPEIYAALGERLKADDARLTHALKAISKEDDPMAAVAHALRTVPLSRSCFALKATAAKALLKKSVPKKAMKQLGYRSFDSMLKHESVPLLFTAAWLSESAAWQRGVIEQYKNLKATDFELRDVAIVYPTSSRWQKLSQTVVSTKRHNIVSFKELGAIVLLPLGTETPRLATTTTLLLALDTWNEIRAGSTFLKLCQVKSNFGKTVQSVVLDEAQLPADLMDQPVPWHIIQRYYARFKQAFRPEVFEPHIVREDLSWHSVEKVLAHLEPSMEFWKGTTHISELYDHKPVSFNMLDVALNYCNNLPYEQRIVQYCRTSLWHELLLRYLNPDNVERTVQQALQSEFATEPALA